MRKTITDENGQVLERLSFDLWGRRRNPNTWEYINTPSNFKYDRGYTGHEHLDDFGLINMNGRVYDPQLARFLSPDPFVQSPLNMQSYNRYSYALNNPLKYIDPSGYVSDNPYDDGSIAPGSGNHWSDQMRSPFMNAMFSNEYYIDRTYGEGTYENLMSRRGAKEAKLIYNPIAGEEIKRDVYQNGNIIHHDIYYSGSYVLSISDDQDGGDGITGIPKSDVVSTLTGASAIPVNTLEGGFDAARVTQKTVSTWSKGARFLGRTSNILTAVTVSYDFATGTANTSTLVSAGVVVVGAGVVYAVGIAASPWVAAGGVVYGIFSLAGGDDWLNSQWDISDKINFLNPSGQ